MSDDISDDGVKVILSPVQLAAVLDNGTIDEATTFRNRLMGGLTLLGGALELVGSAALLLAPEPTGATKVGGVVLAVHGSDTSATGLTQIITGRTQTTLTAQAAAAAARSLGVSDENANTIGTAVDILVPIAVVAAVGAVRALAVRAGRVSLAAEEAAGGHTIARHVGKTEAELRARLAAEPNIPAAGTFRTLSEAEKVLSDALRRNAQLIRSWSTNANSNAVLRIDFDAGRDVGFGVIRQTNLLQQMQKVRIILRKTAIQNKIYFILTSFPVP